MRVKVIKGHKSIHVFLVDTYIYQDTEGRKHINESIKEIVLQQKDERWRRKNCMLCIGLLKLYFPEVKQLEKFKETVEFDDRGFFETFPYEIIGKIHDVQGGRIP